MSHIVIISEENLFREALSDIVSRELGAEVTALESTKALAALDPQQVDMVIATKTVKWPGRVLTYKAGDPQKIGRMLSDIAAQLAEKSPPQIALTDVITLHEKNKVLERIDTGATLDLTEKEQALLLFIKTTGEAAREDILKNVWGFAEGVSTSTLETHIYRLRQKWRELADDDCIIATDKGYRWYDYSA
jgi:hypothetical protein